MEMVQQALRLSMDPGGLGAIEDTPRWSRLTSAARTHHRNAVFWTAPDADPTELVPEMLDHYGDTPFRWLVGPDAPPELVGALERAGFAFLEEHEGLVLALEGFRLPRAAQVEVREAVTDADARAWSDVTVEAWQMPDSWRESWWRVVQAERRVKRLYTAFVDGRPVGAASTIPAPGFGYLSGAAVLPDARGRGVYSALLDRRCADLRETGRRHAVNLALSTTSAPICRGLGFQHVCSYRIYVVPG